MDNMSKIAKAHNSRIVNQNHNQTIDSCNCRRKKDCPIPGKCTARSIVYEAKVKTHETEKIYIVLTANTFKTRYTSHKASFTHADKRHQTELSKFIWTLKDKAIPYTLSWKIVRHAQPYSPKTNRCNLCLWEKYHIITANKATSLNSRTELISTCKHRKKFLLASHIQTQNSM